jgi:hypothetical protein
MAEKANYADKDAENQAENLNQLEDNVINSFRLAKNDVIDLNNSFLQLSQTQARIMEMLKELKANEVKIAKSLRQVNETSSRRLRELTEKELQLYDRLKKVDTQVSRKVRELNQNSLQLYKQVKALDKKPVVKKAKPKVKRSVKPKAKKPVKVKVVRAKCKGFVAARGSLKVHKVNCPFAQNIKPKNKLKFKSRTKALNEGFKLCKCSAK